VGRPQCGRTDSCESASQQFPATVEHADDAREALTAWDGKDHPGGPRIKGGGIDPAEPNARLLSLPRHDSRMIDGLP